LLRRATELPQSQQFEQVEPVTNRSFTANEIGIKVKLQVLKGCKFQAMSVLQSNKKIQAKKHEQEERKFFLGKT
jgi:hypothetical protein